MRCSEGQRCFHCGQNVNSKKGPRNDGSRLNLRGPPCLHVVRHSTVHDVTFRVIFRRIQKRGTSSPPPPSYADAVRRSLPQQPERRPLLQLQPRRVTFWAAEPQLRPPRPQLQSVPTVRHSRGAFQPPILRRREVEEEEEEERRRGRSQQQGTARGTGHAGHASFAARARAGSYHAHPGESARRVHFAPPTGVECVSESVVQRNRGHVLPPHVCTGTGTKGNNNNGKEKKKEEEKEDDEEEEEEEE